MARSLDYCLMVKQAGMKRKGILGGSFNPVHHGHLILARDALEAFALESVVLVPCATPPHKPATLLAPAAHRAAMLERALAGDPQLVWSRLELDRTGISYSVDTVSALCAAEPDVEWHFIIGADSLPELVTWHRIEELLAGCRCVTMQRPGMPDQATLRAAIRLPAPWPDRLLGDLFPGHLVDISSSDIRRRVAVGRSIRYLVPEPVEAYITEHHLYQNA